MNDLICSSSAVMPLHDQTSNSLMHDVKSISCFQPIIDWNHLVKKCKTRSHVKHGLLWLDCDSQIRTLPDGLIQCAILVEMFHILARTLPMGWAGGGGGGYFEMVFWTPWKRQKGSSIGDHVGCWQIQPLGSVCQSVGQSCVCPGTWTTSRCKSSTSSNAFRWWTSSLCSLGEPEPPLWAT